MSWLKWYFWDSRRCEHVPGDWAMIDLGRHKIKHCIKCGRCVDFI